MKNTARNVWLWISLLLLFGSLVASVLGSLVQKHQEQAIHADMQRQLRQHAVQLEKNLNRIFDAGRWLSSEVALSQGLNADRLEQFAAAVVERHSCIINVSLSDGLFVNFIYPLKGNEAVLGMNYRFRPDVMRGVERAITSRGPVVSGPLKLVQSSRLGILGRTPVFSSRDGKEHLLGIVSIVVDLECSLEQAGLTASALPFEVAIRGVEEQGADGEVFYGPSDLFKQSHESADVHFPQGSWRMVAVPKVGIQALSAWPWIVRLLIGLVCLIGAIVLLKRQARKGKTPHEKALFGVRTFLMLFLLLTLLPVVLVTGYLSYQHAQTLSKRYAQELSVELGARVYEHIVSFFDVPRRVLTFNLELANAGLLPHKPPQRDRLMQTFLLQLRQQSLLTFVSMGMADGAYYAGSRPPLGSDRGLRMLYSDAKDGYVMHIHRVDDASRQSSLVSVGSRNFDARTRPWFQAALARGSMGWYSVYPYKIEDSEGAYNTVGMGMSAPLYDENGQFLGVATADLSLVQLSSSLAELMPREGIAFIMESNGELLAASAEPVYRREGESIIRLKPEHVPNRLFHAAGIELQSRQGQPDGSRVITVAGQSYRLDWRNYTLMQGPTLTIVLMLPEARFSEAMDTVLLSTVALTVLVLMLCLVVGLFASSWVAKPLSALSIWASRLAQGDWSALSPKPTPVREVVLLASSLKDMGQQLQQHTEDLEFRIQQRTADLECLNQRLHTLSTTDALTGVGNRRYFDDSLDKEWSRSLCSGTSLGLLMLDVDFFKKYNDFYGHMAGDVCLKNVAGIISAQMAGMDGGVVARYGGEEFVVILPSTDTEQAHLVANKIREAVLEAEMPHPEAPLGKVSVSIGVSVGYPGVDLSSQDLVYAADSALYRAKEKGRNCVC